LYMTPDKARLYEGLFENRGEEKERWDRRRAGTRKLYYPLPWQRKRYIPAKKQENPSAHADVGSAGVEVGNFTTWL